jgi:hypothetical protein
MIFPSGLKLSNSRFVKPGACDNRMMSRSLPALLLGLSLLTGCGNSMRNKARVQQAIMDRLAAHSGLDMNAIDVNTTSVTFKGNTAYATVAFHPKGDTNVSSGMIMKYTLEARNGKWVVVNVADSQGHGMAGHPSASAGAEQLPPGHPPLDQLTQPSSPQPASNGQAQ